MRLFKIASLVFCASFVATAADAQAWNNSGNYNGYGASNQNTPITSNLRDSNGNLTMVDGQITSANFGSNQGGQSAGVGTGGAGAAYGQASAIGNQLQVQVIGFNNTVVIDSRQTNNGNQTATVDLNTH
jgi:holdfast attachment protein HfaA